MEILLYIGVFLFLVQLSDFAIDVFTQIYWSLKQKTIQKKLLENHPQVSEIPKYKHWFNNIEQKYCNQSTYPRDWVTRRAYVADLYSHNCALCGSHVDIGHVHHITFLKKGGTNSLENLAYLCRSCHASIHPHMWKKRKVDLKEIERQGISEDLYYKRKKISNIEYRKILKSTKCSSKKSIIADDLLDKILSGDVDIDKLLKD